jgi:hypothetical protein
MSYPEYANWVPLPAPVTSGTGVQSFVAPDGEVWVAANGVYAGAWKKARDVLHARYYRTAAFNILAAAALLVFDTVDPLAGDPYGIGSAGYLTAPVAGLYRISGQTYWGTLASIQYASFICYVNGGATSHNMGQAIAPASAGLGQRMPFDSGVHRLNAGDTMSAWVSGSSTLSGSPSQNTTWISIDYVGTG